VIRKSRPSARVENISPNPDNKFLQSSASGVIRDAAPQGAVCVRVHRANVWNVVGFTVVNAGYKFGWDLIE
jgi:hypothetical protein